MKKNMKAALQSKNHKNDNLKQERYNMFKEINCFISSPQKLIFSQGNS